MLHPYKEKIAKQRQNICTIPGLIITGSELT